MVEWDVLYLTVHLANGGAAYCDYQAQGNCSPWLTLQLLYRAGDTTCLCAQHSQGGACK